MPIKRFCSIWRGRRRWLKIQKKYDVNHGKYVVLMPEDDQELNGLTLRHMEEFIIYRKAEGVIIITKDPWMKEQVHRYSNHVIDVVDYSTKEIDDLLSFYEFYRFSERLLIVSLEKPNGNRAWQAIGVNGVSKEDMVCLGILCIRHWSSEVGQHG